MDELDRLSLCPVWGSVLHGLSLGVSMRNSGHGTPRLLPRLSSCTPTERHHEYLTNLLKDYWMHSLVPFDSFVRTLLDYVIMCGVE